MIKSARIVSIALAVILCFMFVVSIIETKETVKDTRYDGNQHHSPLRKIFRTIPRKSLQKAGY